MLGWRLVPEDLLNDLRSRIKALEELNTSLIDRLSIQAGAGPASPEMVEAVEKGEKKAKEELSGFLTEIWADEVGVPEKTDA